MSTTTDRVARLNAEAAVPALARRLDCYANRANTRRHQEPILG